MNNKSYLTWAIIALVIMNLALMAFLLLGKGKPRPGGRDHQNNKHKITKIFDFDKDQEAQFEASRETHKSLIASLNTDLKDRTLEYYQATADSTKSKLLIEINDITSKIYQANDTHINDLRAICTEDQLPKVDGFIRQLLKKKGPPRRK